MKRKPTMLVLLLFVPLSLVAGQETMVTINEKGATKVIGCTNGGRLQLFGDVRVQSAIQVCTDSNCKAIAHDQIVAGAHLPPGSSLVVFCTTKAEDEQSVKDTEFCKNNASNPRPQSDAETEKFEAEYFQCLKDRAEFRRQKKQ